MKIFYYYIALVSILAVIITGYDKIASKRWRRHRIPEARLLLLAALGGSASMLLTMLLIRHKTRHRKFMLGLPLILLGQAAALLLLRQFGVV